MPIGTVIYLPNESGPPAQAPRAQSPGAAPTGPTWNDFPPEYRAQLQALEHQYEAMVGFRVPISDQLMLQMAQNGVTDMWEFSQSAWGTMGTDQQGAMPWAQFGMDHETFTAAVSQYQDLFSSLTGQTATPEVLAAALKATQGRSDVSHWRQMLTTDKNVLSTYAWVQYGMSYQDFQTWRDQQKAAYGGSLTDAQASTILKDQHVQRTSAGQAGHEATIQAAPQPEKAGQQVAGGEQASTR
jgi:hypothetical protein